MRIIRTLRRLFPLDLIWAWGSILLLIFLAVYLFLESI